MGGKVSVSEENDARLKFGEEVLDLLEAADRPRWTDQARNIIDWLEEVVNDPRAIPETAKSFPQIKDVLRSLRDDLMQNLQMPQHADRHTPMDWIPSSRYGQDAPRALSVGVATSKEDDNWEAVLPGHFPETPTVAPHLQAKPSRREADTKKKHSADRLDPNQVAALAQQVRLSKQESERSKEACNKLWNETEALKKRLSIANDQIGKLNAQVASTRSAFVGKIAKLEERRDELQKQLRAVESQKGKEAGAQGLYQDSGATPADLLKAAEGIKFSSQDFSKELMRFANKEWREEKLQYLRTQQHGINLARPNDVKFWIQREIVGIAFRQLWDSGIFSRRCCPRGSDVSESQQHWYDRYRLLRDDADHIPKMLDLSAAPLAVVDPRMGVRCFRTACVDTNQPCRCGGAEFASFCYNNLSEIEQLDIWQLVPTQDVVRIKESFVAHLTDVWLAHLLALAFEQPACLFKVDQGQDFSKATMESAVIQEELDDEEEQIRAHPKVEFMIIPGFRVGRSVIQTHVYIGGSS